MAKLLNTKLPIAFGEVNPDVYNRMIRTVELSLNSFDPTKLLVIKINLMLEILYGILH